MEIVPVSGDLKTIVPRGLRENRAVERRCSKDYGVPGIKRMDAGRHHLPDKPRAGPLAAQVVMLKVAAQRRDLDFLPG